MKKILIALLIFNIFFLGCARSLVRTQNETTEEYYLKISKICKDREVRIKTASGDEFAANDVIVGPDSIVYREAGSDTAESIPSGDVNKIIFSQPGPSILVGALIGTSAGFLTIYTAVKAGAFDNYRSPYLIIIFPAVGLLVGTLIGIFNGSQIEINVNN